MNQVTKFQNTFRLCRVVAVLAGPTDSALGSLQAKHTKVGLLLCLPLPLCRWTDGAQCGGDTAVPADLPCRPSAESDRTGGQLTDGGRTSDGRHLPEGVQAAHGARPRYAVAEEEDTDTTVRLKLRERPSGREDYGVSATGGPARRGHGRLPLLPPASCLACSS